MNNEIIKNFTNYLLPFFNNNLSEEDVELLTEPFTQYIEKKYENSAEKLTSKNAKPDMLITLFGKTESERWSHLSAEGKKSLLITDDVFEQFQDKSNEILMLAQQKHQSGKILDKEKAKKMEEELQQLKDGVKEFNAERAELLMGDAILDLNFATGIDQCMSFRLKNSL